MTGRRHFGSTRKLPSGRWQASYWHEGVRHLADRTFPAKADALAWLSRVETAIHGGLWVDPAGGRLTVEELAARWLVSTPAKRASSHARDETIMRLHVVPAIGSRRVGTVTRADVQGLVDRWAATSAPSTVGRMFSALRAAFGYAEAARLIARSPCTGVRLPRVALVARPQLTAGQLDVLAGELGAAQAPMMWLGAVAGLRWAEAAGLTVADLDLLGAGVRVTRQLGRDGALGPLKSPAGRRGTALPDWLISDLAAALAQRGLTAAHGGSFVFVTPEGHQLDYSRWRSRAWVPACARAELAGLRFHDLRSMAATALVAAGVDVKTAQTRLGHSSPAVTLWDLRPGDSLGRPSRGRRCWQVLRTFAHAARTPSIERVIDRHHKRSLTRTFFGGR